MRRAGGGAAPATTLNWTPISVAPLLAEAFWKEPRPVGAALISATLSTGGGFGYVRERLGIPAPAPIGEPRMHHGNHCWLAV